MRMIPPLPESRPATFRTTVHGTVFGERAALVAQVAQGDELILIPDPPMEDDPMVWVHARGGEPLGHLPPEINQWLAPWLLRGGSGPRHRRARARRRRAQLEAAHHRSSLRRGVSRIGGGRSQPHCASSAFTLGLAAKPACQPVPQTPGAGDPRIPRSIVG